MENKFVLVAALVLGLSACAGDSAEPEPATGLHPINDTGTAHCRNGTGEEVDCTAAVAQDGNSGRDFIQPTKTGAGPYGFDWTKLGSGGEPLPVQDRAWSNGGIERDSNQWSCVQDNHTGLRWEVKSDNSQAVNYYLNRYSWFSADATSNGGNTGDENTEDCNGVACNTQAYITHLNAINYCGRSDWRLPSVNELLSLVITENLDLVIDSHYFPNTFNDQYWTRHTQAANRANAWYVYFSDGSFGNSQKMQPNFLRLVSDGRELMNGEQQ